MGTHSEGAGARLPRPASTFVGRAGIIADIQRQFDTARLITLTGAGGIGKTRLATELRIAVSTSDAFTDGTAMVELAQIRTDDDVPETVVRALGLSAATALGPVAQLAQYVSDRDMLLVLDNCEHVLAGCRALVDALLQSSPGLCVLTTSREPLGITGEQVINVRPLTVPPTSELTDAATARSYEAVALLEDRARAVNDKFCLDESNVQAAIDICIQLDGLPLAIELAAARLRTLSVHQLLDRIDNRFATLTKGDPTASPHHRTLEALVQWSYELCSEAEQQLWNRISVFAGSADLDAIIGICAPPTRSEDEFFTDLDGLVSKSILIPDHVSGGVRYRLLETIAEYGRQRLDSAADGDTLRARHADYYLRLAQNAATGFYSDEQKLWMLRLQIDSANLNSAFEWLLRTPCDDGCAALDLASSLRFYWTSRNLREGRRWLDEALAGAVEPTDSRARALYATAWVALLQGDPSAARTYLQEAGRIAHDNGSAALAAHVATWTGTLALFTGNLQAARAAYEMAHRGHREHQDLEGLLMTLFQLGITCVLLDDSSAAHAACNEAIELSRACGEGWAQSYALWTLGHDAWVRSDPHAAEDLARQSLRLKYDFDDELGIALVLGVLAGAAADTGKFERAACLIGIAERTWRALGTGVAAFGPQLAQSYLAVADRTRSHLGDKYSSAFSAGARMNAERRQRFVLSDTTTDSAPQAAPKPDALSRREREVAILLARGLTNRQIADQLVLSHRTVEGHVEHILAKLGFQTRTEIGVWAASHLSTDVKG